MQKDQYELELKGLGAKSPAAADYRQRIEDFGKKIAKYEAEKSDIQKEAKKFETIRDDAQKHGQAFGIAVIFLQIAILLSSIAALIKKKPVWLLGLAVGVVGIVYFINGFFLFIK
jgi:hypothetical protein